MSTIPSLLVPSVRRLLAIATLATLGCASAIAAPQSSEPAGDFLAGHIDRSVDPGVDFFQYANGGWFKRNPIPASEASWGIGNVVMEQLYASLRQINETAAASAQAANSDQQKISDFWSTAMDTAKAEQQGVHPLDAELARIAAVKNARDAVDVAFAQQPLHTGALFGVAVFQDERASDVMAVHLSQDGLGLPDREFYFSKDKSVARIRQQYLLHIGRTLALLGGNKANAAAAAGKVMAFETALARLSRKLEDLRDPVANYHKMTPAEVQAQLTPSIDWPTQLATLQMRTDTVVVGQPEFFSGLEKLLAATPVAVLQDYLRYHLVDAYAAFLNKAFDDEHFSFANVVLSGQKTPRPRWKRVLDAQDKAMGMALGRLFVQEHFPESSKRRYTEMVEAIRTAYLERIDALDWMSEETKARARTKLAGITRKVGYPEQWKDYSTLVIGRDSYAANMMSASRWNYAQTVGKLGKPVDRSEWDMNPQTYNAYYNPSNNEIVLPAAIFLINGVKDAEVDDAVAYGYAGATTIGHEITHGFDDQGRQFDAAGNLTDWWTADDARQFGQRADLMVAQFNSYQPFPGMHINGKAALGENIADYGGALLGLQAFKKTEQYKQGKTIGGLTPTQRYFLGYALGWMNQTRDEALRQHLLSDVHAPSKWRVLGPLSNLPEFHEAFGIKPGQPMYRAPAERVRIW
ncbi:MAG: M13 family metallopeptidase [Burkholderiaceae bacterium]|nr:M13 family metallopeptidase [Burkholderiaceae bacterium]